MAIWETDDLKGRVTVVLRGIPGSGISHAVLQFGIRDSIEIAPNVQVSAMRRRLHREQRFHPTAGIFQDVNFFLSATLQSEADHGGAQSRVFQCKLEIDDQGSS